LRVALEFLFCQWSLRANSDGDAYRQGPTHVVAMRIYNLYLV
jgi:hypothetical protein